jgi:hypothetical protein
MEISAGFCRSLPAKNNGVHWHTFWEVLNGFFRGGACKLKNMRNAGRLVILKYAGRLKVLTNGGRCGYRKIRCNQATANIDGA